MKTIGDNLRKIREDRGMTQTELAMALGVSDGAVSAWESSRNRPKYDHVLNLAKALHCSVSDIYNDTAYAAVFGVRPPEDAQVPSATISGLGYTGVPVDRKRRGRVGEMPETDKTIMTKHGPARVTVKDGSINVELESIRSYVLSEQEQKLVAYYRIMSQAQQESFVNMAKSMVEK